MAQESTITIDKFLGLHQDSTDGLNIEVGELAELTNIRITENYKMRKREGYLRKLTVGTSDINLIAPFSGKVLVAVGTNLFEFDETELA
jgi:hypothetical protein